jgi:hypothetical protein
MAENRKTIMRLLTKLAPILRHEMRQLRANLMVRLQMDYNPAQQHTGNSLKRKRLMDLRVRHECGRTARIDANCGNCVERILAW